MAAGLEWLQAEPNPAEFGLLCRWFGQVLALRERFLSDVCASFDPLRSNETASVGLLGAAACRSGLLSLTDYVSYKRGHVGGSRYRHGRCDLWIADPARDLSLAFEFKQTFYGAATRTATIRRQLDRACYDARQIDVLEAHRRFGALLTTIDRLDLAAPIAEARLAALAPHTSYACRLGGGTAPVWLFLQAI
jgi:hypothetical protein